MADYAATTPVDDVPCVLSNVHAKEFMVVAASFVELCCVAGCVASVLKLTSCAEQAGDEAAIPKATCAFGCRFSVCFA